MFSMVLVCAGVLCETTHGQVVTVGHTKKISSASGELSPSLSAGDNLGRSIASIGDLDGNGVGEIAVGAWRADIGGPDRGAVHIMFMEADASVSNAVVIADGLGGFSGGLDDFDLFGSCIEALGDVNGDGVPDLAVGSLWDDDGGPDRGALWILFLNSDGTVAGNSKISDTSGGFLGQLDDDDRWPTSIAALGDLNGDGCPDIWTGVASDDDGGPDRGAGYILFLSQAGDVREHNKVSSGTVAGLGVLDDGDEFGFGAACLGDLDGTGGTHVAVGVKHDDDGGPSRGAIYVLRLESDGAAEVVSKISATSGNGPTALDDWDHFGMRLDSPGDLDGDGVVDLVATAVNDDDGATDAGALWFLFLNTDGTAKGYSKVSSIVGGLGAILHPENRLGAAITGIGDIDGNGVVDIAAGAIADDDGGPQTGAVFVLQMNGPATAPWSLLGNALVGQSGAPVFGGEGALAGSDFMTLELSNARPLAVAFLVIGFTAIGLPFKGGTLVPDPTLLFTSTTDFFGDLSFAGLWPTGVPPGSTTYFQYWIVDDAGPKGFAASNGLSGTAP